MLVSTIVGGIAAPTVVHATPAAARRSCAVAGAQTYTVTTGESWFQIAQAVGVRAAVLLQANDASADTTIYPGDVLCLPAGATAPAPGDRGSSCGTAGGSYRVEQGDSWFGIANRVGARMASMLDANHATADSALQPGDVLCLPAGATAKAAEAKPTHVAIEALPLQGPCGFGDTWRDARGNGRRHEGVDLIAAAGKYVYAVVDGVLTRRAWDQPGGLSGNGWWLTSADGSGTYFFYAHLYAFAPGLKVGSNVRAGQIIGFVGTTGNSSTSHLHFEIHPNGGDPINPYATIRSMGGCNTGTAYRQPGGWVPDTAGVDVG
jgi:murein DD-endopeptidase MepM/ murein hydrolase activator NlpD